MTKQANSATSSSRFVPALQGVRGLAIALVVVHHAYPRWQAGRVGVDVFFVLSGYLITGHLIAEAMNGGIRMRAFYRRRAARLYPALLAMLVVIVPATLLVDPFLPTLVRGSFAATYTTNIADSLGIGTGYLGHTWSLSQEEQFYLVWPWVLAAMFRRRWPLLRVARALSGIGFVSLVLLVTLSGDDITRNPIAQFGGLALGSALAAFSLARRGEIPWRVGLGRLGLLALAGSLALQSVGVLSLRAHTVSSTVAAVAIIGSAVSANSTALVRVLSLRLLVGLGEVSYSLYLWHYPVFHLLRSNAAIPAWLLLALGGSTSLLLAYVSRRWVEIPVLRWSRERGNRLPSGAEVPLRPNGKVGV